MLPRVHKEQKERNAEPFRIESSETTSVMLFLLSIKLSVRLLQLNGSVTLLLTTQLWMQSDDSSTLKIHVDSVEWIKEWCHQLQV